MLRPRMPIVPIGIAMGLLLSASSPAPAADPKFVGDAGNQGPAVSQRLQDSATFRRWGGGTGSDTDPQVFLKENPAGRIKVHHVGDPNDPLAPSPAKIRSDLQAYLNTLDPNSAEYQRLKARLALIPPGQDGSNPAWANDVHPIQFLEWLKLQTDNNQGLIEPKPNTITIVDQQAIEALLAAHQPLPQPIYRTVTTTIITHHLVPTYATVYTQFPV